MDLLSAIIAGMFMWPPALANAWIYVVSGAPPTDIAAVVALTIAAAIHMNVTAGEFRSKVATGLWDLGPHVMFTNLGAVIMFFMFLISLLHGFMKGPVMGANLTYLMFMAYPSTTFWGIAMGIVQGLIEESDELEPDAFTLGIGTAVLAVMIAAYLALTLPWPWNAVAGTVGVASVVIHEYVLRRYGKDFILV